MSGWSDYSSPPTPPPNKKRKEKEKKEKEKKKKKRKRKRKNTLERVKQNSIQAKYPTLLICTKQ